MGKSVVGITCDIKGKYFESEKFYSEKILEVGGVPFYLPMITSQKDVRLLVTKIDAIIISGSRDINPSFSDQKKTRNINPLDLNRTKSEILYINEMNKKKKKILGICGGMQLVNVCLGGTLFQDIKSIFPKSIKHTDGARHTINIASPSLLNKIVKKKTLKVKSYHHQAVDRIAKTLKSSAESSDQIIEALESDNQKILGVQWHPELSKSKTNLNIFKWLTQIDK